MVRLNTLVRKPAGEQQASNAHERTGGSILLWRASILRPGWLVGEYGSRQGEHERQLCGLTGSETLARIFVLEQCFRQWVQHVRSMPGGRRLTGWEWKSGPKDI
jgi:hypothetical protein